MVCMLKDPQRLACLDTCTHEALLSWESVEDDLDLGQAGYYGLSERALKGILPPAYPSSQSLFPATYEATLKGPANHGLKHCSHFSFNDKLVKVLSQGASIK